ncbi:ArsS family sensor histidine kinase [Sulfurimonas sp.]|uniref:ArsS family sensor histidine kinase n=1 Tax=Sulfurimonas sp. TaxID=2022749 RepID=UPI003D0CBCB7
MSINKDSLITKLALFFIVLFVSINFLFYLDYDYRKYKEQNSLYEYMSQMAHLINERRGDVNLSEFHILISSLSRDTLKSEAKELQNSPFETLYLFKNKHYFVGCRPPKPPQDDKHDFDFFEDKKPPKDFFDHANECIVLESLHENSNLQFWLLIGMTNFVLILFFAYFTKKLLRLHQLESAIARLDNDTQPIPLQVDTNDEIGKIALEYNKVQERLATMKEARTLFLRNILHELRTPFMKGRLLNQYIDDISLKKRFAQLFERMEFVLGELGKIEKLTSGNLELNAHLYRLGDLYDHAYDLLLHDETRIVLQGDRSIEIKADFEYFGVALKNLIDNALRYSDNEVQVELLEDRIVVCSKGEKLSITQDSFLRPFNRDFEGGGLGLGLYITNTILKHHNFVLIYTNKNKTNYFSIVFK